MLVFGFLAMVAAGIICYFTGCSSGLAAVIILGSGFLGMALPFIISGLSDKAKDSKKEKRAKRDKIAKKFEEMSEEEKNKYKKKRKLVVVLTILVAVALGAGFTLSNYPCKVFGHKLVHHDAKEPTCTERGWEEYDDCQRCDYTTFKAIPMNGHEWGEWKTTKEPTKDSKGEKQQTCSVCGYVHTETIPELGDGSSTSGNKVDYHDEAVRKAILDAAAEGDDIVLWHYDDAVITGGGGTYKVDYELNHGTGTQWVTVYVSYDGEDFHFISTTRGN